MVFFFFASLSVTVTKHDQSLPYSIFLFPHGVPTTVIFSPYNISYQVSSSSLESFTKFLFVWSIPLHCSPSIYSLCSLQHFLFQLSKSLKPIPICLGFSQSHRYNYIFTHNISFVSFSIPDSYFCMLHKFRCIGIRSQGRVLLNSEYYQERRFWKDSLRRGTLEADQKRTKLDSWWESLAQGRGRWKEAANQLPGW